MDEERRIRNEARAWFVGTLVATALLAAATWLSARGPVEPSASAQPPAGGASPETTAPRAPG
jgi:hypothetical protein